MPMIAGKVDCIFIDPPYNTGNEGWAYSDSMKSPIIALKTGRLLAGKPDFLQIILI